VLADAGAVPGWEGGSTLFHYNPFWHALEVLCELPPLLWADIEGQLPAGAVLIVVTAIYWRAICPCETMAQVWRLCT